MRTSFETTSVSVTPGVQMVGDDPDAFCKSATFQAMDGRRADTRSARRHHRRELAGWRRIASASHTAPGEVRVTVPGLVRPCGSARQGRTGAGIPRDTPSSDPFSRHRAHGSVGGRGPLAHDRLEAEFPSVASADGCFGSETPQEGPLPGARCLGSGTGRGDPRSEGWCLDDDGRAAPHIALSADAVARAAVAMVHDHRQRPSSAALATSVEPIVRDFGLASSLEDVDDVAASAAVTRAPPPLRRTPHAPPRLPQSTGPYAGKGASRRDAMIPSAVRRTAAPTS
ncbi:hypothetical protein GGR04_004098 [Aureimonas pseudogalii]|uniref:Uncharacterized protein n=1 Tax=Aureimonas pseudogalii TaxID=1744844 RepID=A0A7W6H7Z4_9HYPH|nr:hypothetical protein [Aureimonas pseudogalii]